MAAERRTRDSVRSVAGTAALILLMLLAWWLGSELEIWNPGLLPPPVDVAGAVVELLTGTPGFYDALRTTVFTIAVAYALSVVLGFTIGFVFWRKPLLGRVLEPVVVATYAVPFIVFYPVTLVVIGITPWSIIVLAVALSMIPMLLNTWIGLRAVPAVLFKLGTVYDLSLPVFMRKIAVPHAGPQLFAGLRLSLIFTIISVIAMEFLMFPQGLGFEVRYQYQYFNQIGMLAYMVFIFTLAILATVALRAVESVVERGRS